jgi:hypothetical protein
VDRHAGRHAGLISTHNLYQYREPMSPHLAAKLAPDLVSTSSIQSLTLAVPYFERRTGSIDFAIHVRSSRGPERNKGRFVRRDSGRCTLSSITSTTHAIHLSTFTPPASYPYCLATPRRYIDHDSILRITTNSRVFDIGRPLPTSAILPEPRISH